MFFLFFRKQNEGSFLKKSSIKSLMLVMQHNICSCSREIIREILTTCKDTINCIQFQLSSQTVFEAGGKRKKDVTNKDNIS